MLALVHGPNLVAIVAARQVVGACPIHACFAMARVVVTAKLAAAGRRRVEQGAAQQIFDKAKLVSFEESANLHFFE